MQERLQEIREMYQKIKSDMSDMEKQWKVTQEKQSMAAYHALGVPF